MFTKIKSLRFHIPTFAHLVHRGESFAHIAYLSACSAEAHGYYQKGAALLLAFVIASLFVKEEGA